MMCGNVKSLLQQIPGLDAKRTDYVYDLISGKVNYVFYQYDKPDQFIHKYEYDSDNRIEFVSTSTDGFVWDNDASYFYYAHGPLARVELGHHRVQGLDYYYTLQGWIKGVNMPYEGDPGGDGVTSLSGKDVFAYSLGYNNNDYKPINNSVTLTDTRDHLWTRLNEVNNHSGLYNGNISWMVTDLSAIASAKADRTKGMQAMVYQYDQLHRIVKSRSLTNYSAANGFASRSTSPAAYDEDYSYDPNGNLLTLHRRNHLGDTLHNFNYQYYPGTNKLRQVGPPEDMVFDGGPLVSNNKLYRKITVQGNAYMPQGRPVELRALEEIEMDPDFKSPDGTDFWAHIVADSGMYQYDKIGNLVLDQHEGVKISWTPYGKVREVKAKNDSLITTFRYDGAGNRIEKKVTRKDSVDIISITHYVRDASGNVMGVYKDSLMLEQYVYGSSRVGLYKGGRYNGQRSLGEKNYELGNHLGNVLAVTTDNIGMNTMDSIWATVVSTRDYYPFGLEMEDRTWSDTTSIYRHAFNGKEKDGSGEFGNATYDYGFRIYNPTISKFLSTDPLTEEFPWWSPYQFAGNTPILAADLDGAEPIYKTKVEGSTEATLNNIDEDAILGYLVLNWKASARNLFRNAWVQLKAGQYSTYIVRDRITVLVTPDGVPYLYEEEVMQDRIQSNFELILDGVGSYPGIGKGAGPGGGLLAKTPGKSTIINQIKKSIGELRELEVARLTKGRVAKDGKGQDLYFKFVRENGLEGGVAVDVIGESGELILVGGPAKAHNLSALGQRLSDLKLAAKDAGVKALAYFTDNTPNAVIDLAQKKLGKENVKVFKDVESKQ